MHQRQANSIFRSLLRVSNYKIGHSDLNPLKHITIMRGVSIDVEDAVPVGEYPIPDRELISDYPIKYYSKSKSLFISFIESKNVIKALILDGEEHS